MSLFLTMLPIYLFGNLHCIGMCGPLVMMIGQHKYRYFYFLGRLTSFSLAGLLAGEIGAVLHIILARYYIPAITSFLFGGLILSIGIYSFFGWHYPGYQFFAKKLRKINSKLSLLILRDTIWPTFLFGFFTLALPCGQTLLVFSACALSADGYVGLFNGFAFALITSPSLWFAMHVQSFLHKIKPYYNSIMGTCAIIVGLLACFRGFAEIDAIPHLILNPESPSQYHIVIY